jgi:hypothetical protein
VHGDDVVIATHGRGFWVLDDVSPLRQWVAERAHVATRLFAPSAAIRVRPAGFTGTPLPKDEPTAINPSFGARIDYRLAEVPKSAVELDILDAAGQRVRHYASTDAPPKFDAAKAGIAPEWFVAPSVLASTPGMHRFIWPLRYAPLPALAGGNAYSDGTWAPPGDYTIVLTVDGKSYRQPLAVVADPRVHVPSDAYAAQFAFARQVEAAQARLAVAQAEAARVHGQVRAARKAAGPTVDGALAALDAKVTDIAGIVDVANPGNAGVMPPKHTQTFGFLAQALGKLANAADDADAAPSPDARAGYATLLPLLDATLARWQRVLATGLPPVNAQLKAAGKPELTATEPGKAP